MRRVGRHVFAILAVLSLLLCLATLALWVRSYWRYEGLYYAPERTWLAAIESGEGIVGLFKTSEDSDEPPGKGWEFRYLTDRNSTTYLAFRKGGGGSSTVLGFGSMSMTFGISVKVRGLLAPHWFFAMLFAILPAFQLRAILHLHKRSREGLCPRCGYDLRATPERCPECGRANDEIQNQKSESMTNHEIRT
jgi:hypothetical protein